MLHIANFDEIKNGEVTDVYFSRTKEILEAEGIDARVKAEFFAKSLPDSWTWGVFAGLEEVSALLKDLDLKVRAMPEGTIFRPGEPVLEIEGRYLEFGKHETAILGLICQASGVATMAARCRKAAGNKGLFSFGARRMHPAIAPMLERNAYIGGCDGVAVEKGARLIDQPPVGTMPHALILLMGDTVKATEAFDRIIDAKVNRISLVDTFQDEKFEALRVARALGKRLWGVRLDTPSSRRGNFTQIIEEVRWELDLAGFKDVKIVVSGGLDEKSLAQLEPLVDAFGVGTAVSAAPVIDYSMDIIEIDGRPAAKRGKKSGAKDVYRCPSCGRDKVVPFGTAMIKCSCGGSLGSMMEPLSFEPVPAGEIRERVLKQLVNFSLD